MDFGAACRLCLDLSPGSPLSKEGRTGHRAALTENLKLKIYACTSLKVSAGEGLPESVCEPCMRLLDKFFLFRKMCWEVDNKLKLYLCSKEDGSGLPSSVLRSEPVRLDEDMIESTVAIKDAWVPSLSESSKDQTEITKEQAPNIKDLIKSAIGIGMKDSWSPNPNSSQAKSTVVLKDSWCSISSQKNSSVVIKDSCPPNASQIKNEQAIEILNDDVGDKDAVENNFMDSEEYVENKIENMNDAEIHIQEHVVDDSVQENDDENEIQQNDDENYVQENDDENYVQGNDDENDAQENDDENDAQENDDENDLQETDDENGVQEDEKSDEEYVPPKPQHYCEKCDQSFKGPQHLKIHNEDNHPDLSKPVFHCKVCTKPYRHLGRLENHLKIHEALGDIVPETKKKTSNDSDSDSAQPRLNEGNNDSSQSQAEESSGGKKKRFRKVYDCEYCDQVFHSYTKYTLHELTHTGEKKYNCSDCSRSFTHKHSLIGHIREQHTGEVNFTCDVCGRGFVHRSTFNIHKKTHSTEKTLKCPDCDKCFTQMKNLRVHRQIHTASRTHTCQVCGKSFNFLKTLKVHLVLHSGEKPFVCTYCGKAFAQSAPLKTHTRIHTGERPYECKLCPSSYSTSNALKAHVLKHSGEAPYSCSVCNKGFNRKKDMVAHQEENHEVHVGMLDDMNPETNGVTAMPHNSVHNTSMGLQQNCMQLQQPPPLAPMPMLIASNLGTNSVAVSPHHPPPLVPFAAPHNPHNHPQMTLHASQQLHPMTHHPGAHLAASSNCMPHSSTHYNTPQMCTDLPGTDCSGG